MDFFFELNYILILMVATSADRLTGDEGEWICTGWHDISLKNPCKLKRFLEEDITSSLITAFNDYNFNIRE